ncbi:MAG: hypothetical protein IRY99_01330 [Isosphaeraceae bacterium]|nr:hypothetical protein [Isosphaeraceae bacterium]
MTGRIYHPEEKHPEPYQQDLNPDASKGQNYGLLDPHPEKDNPRTAFDVKEAHRRLRDDFTDDELKQIPVLPAGTRLEQGAVYIDLAREAPAEFKATADMEVRADQIIVPKAAVDYELWNRLIGVTNPIRTGRA